MLKPVGERGEEGGRWGRGERGEGGRGGGGEREVQTAMAIFRGFVDLWYHLPYNCSHAVCVMYTRQAKYTKV